MHVVEHFVDAVVSFRVQIRITKRIKEAKLLGLAVKEMVQQRFTPDLIRADLRTQNSSRWELAKLEGFPW